MPRMLIVGLGNPGDHYAPTRHNLGKEFLCQLGKKHALGWEEHERFAAATAIYGNCRLMITNTPMNSSGHPVAAALHYYKISLGQLLVIHDEANLSPGSARIKLGGDNGGHRGLDDIGYHAGNNYWRLRLGIGRKPGPLSEYVLSSPPPPERELIDKAMDNVFAQWTNINLGRWESVKAVLRN